MLAVAGSLLCPSVELSLSPSWVAFSQSVRSKLVDRVGKLWNYHRLWCSWYVILAGLCNYFFCLTHSFIFSISFLLFRLFLCCLESTTQQFLFSWVMLFEIWDLKRWHFFSIGIGMPFCCTALCSIFHGLFVCFVPCTDCCCTGEWAAYAPCNWLVQSLLTLQPQ